MTSLVENIVVLDIDGLKGSVFADALAAGRIPHLSSIVQPQGLCEDLVSAAPSTTFSCQGSIVLGRAVGEHRIVGNQYYDRFGRFTGGRPKHYGFDVGDALSYDDAVAVFSGQGLADRHLPENMPTIFESVGAHGWTSAAIHFMYGRGATEWIKPSIIDLARFKRGHSFLGLSPEAFDRRMFERLRRTLMKGTTPNLLFLYFMGLDMTSHKKGPDFQADYLERVIDPLIGDLLTLLSHHGYSEKTAFLIISDHGQISVQPDSHHALRIGNPFAPAHDTFHAMLQSVGRRLHRFPTTEEASDTIFTANGGLGHLYLRQHATPWKEPPPFSDLVLSVARSLYPSHPSNRSPTLDPRALAAILVRNVEQEGWLAPYRALYIDGTLHTDGTLVPLEEFFSDSRYANLTEPAARIRSLAAPECGDIILLPDSEHGYHFGSPCKGQHGGLHRDESECTFALGAPSLSNAEWTVLESAITSQLKAQRLAQNRHYNTLADIAPVITYLAEDATKSGDNSVAITDVSDSVVAS